MFGEYSLSEDFAFLGVVLVMLYVNLKTHHNDKPITTKNAAIWSVIWVAVALLFAGYIDLFHGSRDASAFLTGYVIEKVLSIDNLFIIMAVFASFRIEEKYQHRVLYWGILLAMVLRFIFVLVGAALIELGGKYVSGLFGGMILWSAWKMLKSVRLPSEAETDYTHHPIVKFTSRFFPIYPYIENQNFFVKKTVEEEGSNLAATRADSEDNTTATSLKWHATPLFLCLIVMELVDVVFAFDSVPAIFAITEKSFLVYTSSIFAILGLRSLYFLIAAAKKYLCHLEKSVVAILLFIGGEMILEFFELIEIKPLVSLGVITGIIAAGVVTSLVGSFHKRVA